MICLVKIIIKKESKFSAISAIKGFILLFLRSVIEVGLATVRKENYRLETFFFFLIKLVMVGDPVKKSKMADRRRQKIERQWVEM